MSKSAICLKVGSELSYWRTESEARAWFRCMYAEGAPVTKGEYGLLSAFPGERAVIGHLSVATYAKVD